MEKDVAYDYAQSIGRQFNAGVRATTITTNPNMPKITILTYSPLYIYPYGIGYAAYSLAVGMNSKEVISDIFSMHSDMTKESNHVKYAIPYRLLYRLVYKVLSRDLGNKWVNRFTEKRFKKLAIHYDVICLWPGCSLETFRYLKSLGKTLVMENINCHQATSKKILDLEQQSLGLNNAHAITEEKISDETEKLTLTDYIFSPSPQVTRSLVENGVALTKIIESSYGLSPGQVLSDAEQNGTEPVFLFVGSVIMRKGIHLLLDYWKAANVEGKLKVVGEVDASMSELIQEYKRDESVEFIPFIEDIGTMYQSADVFVMPSLEEGSPLVTYLALGAGLPCLVSPMAGDGIIRNKLDGFIIEPHDKERWVSVFKQLAVDVELRKKLAQSSRRRAPEFFWSNVAKKRREALLKKIGVSF